MKPFKVVVRRIVPLLGLVFLVAPVALSQTVYPDNEFIQTPSGRVHQSCVHEVPYGSDFDTEKRTVSVNGVVTQTFPECTVPIQWSQAVSAQAAAANAGFALNGNDGGGVPTVNGWLENSWFNAVGVPGGFDFFNYIQGTWTVPGYPTYDNPFPYLQTVYLFNSLEAFNSSGIAIIQPVQQWGNSAAGMCPNTAGFCMASWWVSPGITSYTPLVGVNPGDQIEGSIYLYSFSPPTSATYQVVWDDVTQGLWWWVDFGFNPSTWTFNTAQPAVLEAYNLYNCQNLPTGDWTQFSNIEMFEPDTVWDTYLEVGTDPTTWTRDNPGSGTTPWCGYGVGDWDFGSPLNNTSTLYYVN